MIPKTLSLKNSCFQHVRQKRHRYRYRLCVRSQRKYSNRRNSDNKNNNQEPPMHTMDDEFSQFVEQRLFGVVPNKNSKKQQINSEEEETIPKWKQKIENLNIPKHWEGQKQIFTDILYDLGYVQEHRSLHIHYYAIKRAALNFAENNIEYIDALPAKLIIDVLLNYQEQNAPELIAKSYSRLQGVYTKPQFIGVLKNSRYVFVDLMRLLVLFMEERVEVIQRTSPGLIEALENLMPALLPLMLTPSEVVDQMIKQNSDRARGRKAQISYAHYRTVQEFEDKAMEITRARFGDDGLTSLQAVHSTPDSLLNEARINKLIGNQLADDVESGIFEWDENWRQNERQQIQQSDNMEVNQDQYQLDMPITPESKNRDSEPLEKNSAPNQKEQGNNIDSKPVQQKQNQQQIIFNDHHDSKQSFEEKVKEKMQQNKQQQSQQKQSNQSEEPLEAFWQIMEGKQIDSDDQLTKKQKNNKSKAIEVLKQWDMWEDKQLPNNQDFKYQNLPNNKVMRFQNQYNQQVRTNFPLDDWERQSQFEIQNDDDFDDDDSELDQVRILNRDPQQIEQLQQKKQQFQRQWKNSNQKWKRKNQRGKKKKNGT